MRRYFRYGTVIGKQAVNLDLHVRGLGIYACRDSLLAELVQLFQRAAEKRLVFLQRCRQLFTITPVLLIGVSATSIHWEPVAAEHASHLNGCFKAIRLEGELGIRIRMGVGNVAYREEVSALRRT